MIKCQTYTRHYWYSGICGLVNCKISHLCFYAKFAAMWRWNRLVVVVSRCHHVVICIIFNGNPLMS